LQNIKGPRYLIVLNMTGMIVANEVIYSNDEKFILEDTAIGFSTHRLVNAIKFTIDGGNGPVKLLEEKSLIKKVDCHGR
jgi:hypothetical protein